MGDKLLDFVSDKPLHHNSVNVSFVIWKTKLKRNFENEFLQFYLNISRNTWIFMISN